MNITSNNSSIWEGFTSCVGDTCQTTALMYAWWTLRNAVLWRNSFTIPQPTAKYPLPFPSKGALMESMLMILSCTMRATERGGKALLTALCTLLDLSQWFKSDTLAPWYRTFNSLDGLLQLHTPLLAEEAKPVLFVIRQQIAIDWRHSQQCTCVWRVSGGVFEIVTDAIKATQVYHFWMIVIVWSLSNRLCTLRWAACLPEDHDQSASYIDTYNITFFLGFDFENSVRTLMHAPTNLLVLMDQERWIV